MSESGDHLQGLAWRLRSIVGEENVLEDEPMSRHTSFQIGGPTDLYVIPEDVEELRDVLAACREAGVPTSSSVAGATCSSLTRATAASSWPWPKAWSTCPSTAPR